MSEPSSPKTKPETPHDEDDQPATDKQPDDGSKAESGNESNADPKERFRLKIFKIDSTQTDRPDDEEEPGGSKEENKSEDDEPEPSVQALKPTSLSGPKPLTTVEYKDITKSAFEETTLTEVRKKIAPLVAGSFRFCDEDGAISQDGTTLASYIGELKESQITADNPIKIYITSFKHPKTSVAELLDNPPFVLKFVQKLKDDESQKEGTLHSSSLPNVEGGKITLKQIRKYVKAMSASSSRHQFCLEDGHTVDDAITLKEYVASLSRTVDKDKPPEATDSIEIYFTKPGTMKKSKSKGASDEIKDHPNLKPSDMTLRDIAAFNATRDKELREMKEELDAANFKLEGGEDDAKTAGALTEDEWAAVIRNCNLMFGWVVDSNNNRVVRAPKAAFQLRSGLNMGSTAAETEQDEHAPNSTPPTDKSANQNNESPKIKAPPKARGIPHFAVNDDSRVEVTVVSHEFQESMAKAHFSATTVEAEISGGFGGFSGGVSGAYADESTSNEKSSSQTNEKIMIGTYRFPRATVHLTPSDLEPTPELKAAIKQIRTRKNVMDLRQLHKDFGHLFCRKVVIGGCLQTTKTMTMTTISSEKSERSQFKASVGVAVQTPYASASAKASHERGDASDAGSTKTDTREQLIFEATGGNTIFVSDPQRWTVSVANPNNWRVIEQDALSSMADAISEMAGYNDAPMWFMQAVPSLSKYVEIPKSRTLNVRFKATLNKHVQDRLLGSNGYKYLGHDNDSVTEFVHRRIKALSKPHQSYITPRHENGKLVLDMTAYTDLINDTHEDPLFSPRSARCPALLSYTGILGLEGAQRIDKALFTNLELAKAKVAKATAAKVEVAKLKAVQDQVTKIKQNKSLFEWAKALAEHLGRLKEAEEEAGKFDEAKKELDDASGALKAAKDSNKTAIQGFSREYKNTVWRLEVPDGGVLAHESRVSVRSLAVEPSPTLSVYRNAQGIYLPTMSSYDGPCFWRILKRDPGSREGDPIQDGDDIRLSWRFSDQADGFRDFDQDTFGRRRFTKPNDAGDILYLKVPYPPIQSSSTEIALVLSSSKTRDPIVDRFKTLPAGAESNYNLHDVSFRIDSAGENGMGESMDYMAPVVDSQKSNKDVSWGEDRSQFSIPAMFVGSILLPGATGPAAGSMVRALLL
ncbi:hypothetical protein RhiJN_01491 [Ceratobasidium sp. AG-Ba]|nr:hypothetical protein RhiJN_01491 [Ceratobasidium sp. AG-Ba]QRW02470.1 hypothetical protein RhiLY_01468 [Ceratobasidium sp. AG-Ba]